MGTRALVGHYTDDGAWRAVWVYDDASPEDLGNVFYDFHYFYLFDVADRRLDVSLLRDAL